MLQIGLILAQFLRSISPAIRIAVSLTWGRKRLLKQRQPCSLGRYGSLASSDNKLTDLSENASMGRI